jgi:ribosomal protection tetracycline resistance protein
LRERIKNIGILAHVDAGKTTLTERLLYHTGAIRQMGRVDHGTTQTDGLELERERGISIISMPTSYNYKGWKINIVDTPGHVDFVAEVERSMLVLDSAILVISAKEGVQSHTRLLFNALKRMEVPTLIFVNKIDRLGVDLEKVIADIRTFLSPDICVLQAVSGEGSKDAQVSNLALRPDDELIERLSKVDESIMLDYLDEVEISSERLYATLQSAVAQRVVVPLLFGSALNGIGLPEILDTINDLLPQFEPLETDETSGIVFKVHRRNLKTMRECMVKLTAGQIKLRGLIGEDRITNLSRWNHGTVEVVNELHAGDIGIVMGLHHLSVGDTFGQGTHHTGFSLGKPTLKVKVQADRPTQRRELLEALELMTESDPYLSYELSQFNEDIYINLFGYVQLEITQETIRRDFGIDVQLLDPMTIYMETPKGVGEFSVAMHEDGLPFSAGVGFRVEPLPPGSGVQYVSEVSTGGLRQTFQNGVVDGVYAYLDQGLHGWELTDLKITLNTFEFNSVSSTPSAYRDLSPLILFEALKKAGTKLLWPISEYHLAVPSTLMGRAISDLQRMKATFDEPVMEGDECLLTGIIPVELSHNYELTVRQYTGGLGHYESKVIGYEDAPQELYKERPRFKVDAANRGEYLLSKMRTT